MKNVKIISLLILNLTSISIYAQDVITLRNGEEIKAKVTEINSSEIKYRRFENLEGPTIIVSRADVFFINYENGTRQIINSNSDTKVSQNNTPQNSVQKKETVQPKRDHSVLYVGGVFGGGPSKEELGYMIGINAAVFLKRQIGLGFAVHRQKICYESDSRGMSGGYTRYHEETFFGPVIYGHWGRRTGKVFFHTSFGIGGGAVKSFDHHEYKGNENVELRTQIDGFLSVGMAIRPIKLISIGLNWEVVYRSTITLGLNFHF